MTKEILPDHPSWEAADSAFERFMAELPLRRKQLDDRLRATGGPDLDSSLESLGPLEEWQIEQTMLDLDDGMDWWPTWLRPIDAELRSAVLPWRPLSPQAVRLWELVSVYVGDVLLPQVPHARWVCWRGDRPRDIANGSFALDFGDPKFACIPAAVANNGLNRWYMYVGTGEHADHPVTAGALERRARACIDERDELRRGRPLMWQKAPTGPLAFKRTSKPDW